VPMIACSEIGVGLTRSRPNLADRPLVDDFVAGLHRALQRRGHRTRCLHWLITRLAILDNGHGVLLDMGWAKTSA
jgi:hypothetical protein